MNYPIVQIGDLALQEPGSFKIGPFGSSLKKDELVSSGIPVIAIENTLPNNFITSYRKFITDKKYQELAQYTVQPGDIVVTTMGTIGRAAVVPDGIGIAIIDSHLFRMRVDKTKVYPQYLCYAINGAPSVTNHLERMSRGAIMEGLNTTILKESPIALPPLTEQKRIAGLLARADRLRRLRRYARELSDTYLQSVFVEMFGDPVRNEKGWRRATIVELGKVQTGNTPSRKESEHFGNFIEWIKSDNIVGGQLYVTKSREMLSEVGLRRGRIVDSGAVLVTCIAGSLNHIGDVALTNRKVSFNQQINAISPFHDVNSMFLYSMFHIAKQYIQYNATSGMKHILTKSKFEELVLIKPPLRLQERFAGVVQRYERLRMQQAEAERQADMLFQSLLAQSFGSE